MLVYAVGLHWVCWLLLIAAAQNSKSFADDVL
jgi:hypothetical protein